MICGQAAVSAAAGQGANFVYRLRFPPNSSITITRPPPQRPPPRPSSSPWPSSPTFASSQARARSLLTTCTRPQPAKDPGGGAVILVAQSGCTIWLRNLVAQSARGLRQCQRELIGLIRLVGRTISVVNVTVGFSPFSWCFSPSLDTLNVTESVPDCNPGGSVRCY